MKRTLKLSLILTLLIITISFNASQPKAKAWGPITHMYYTEIALQKAGSTWITDIINNNKDWFYCGLVYPDVTVIYYYTKWESYSATHAFSFQAELWQQAQEAQCPPAQAFALGVAVHLLQDCITHNHWIPYKIKTTFVQNNIIHPLSEGLLETKLAGSGELGDRARTLAQNAFNVWNVPLDGYDYFYDEEKGGYLTVVEWADKVLGRTAENSFKDEAATFAQILGENAFYSKGYTIPSSGGYWPIFRAISDFLKNFVSTEDADPYINMTINATVEFFIHGSGDNPRDFVPDNDPTGYFALKNADAFVIQWTVVVTIIFIVIVLFYYKRKGGS